MDSTGNEPKAEFHIFLNVNRLNHSLAYWHENLPKIGGEIENLHGIFATYTIASILGIDYVTVMPLFKEAADKYEDVLPKVVAVIDRYNA